VRPVEIVAAEVSKRLRALEFSRTTGRVYVRHLGDEAVGWVSLNSASRHRPPGVVEVNPIVSVRHVGIEHLVTELRGDRPSAPQQVTIGSPLGYLMPEARYRGWVIDTTRPQETVEQVQDIVTALQKYGLPYMEKYADLTTLRSKLDAVSRHDQPAMYRRPVAWLLTGRPDQARTELQRVREELGSRADIAAEQFRSFAQKLEERLAAATHER